MRYFLLFMGWFILYSFLFFLIADIRGVTPGGMGPDYSIGLGLAAIPAWWLSWKWFDRLFGPTDPVPLPRGGTAYGFALRNTAFNYYLMVLKPFLLVLGANGIITLSLHHGGMRIFWIVNFVVLYIYAIPFFVIKAKKLALAKAARLILEEHRISLQKNGELLAEVPFSRLGKLTVDEASVAALVEGGDGARIYFGGPKAKGSAFYIASADQLIGLLKQQANGKIHMVDSIKAEMKALGFKPAI